MINHRKIIKWDRNLLILIIYQNIFLFYFKLVNDMVILKQHFINQ